MPRKPRQFEIGNIYHIINRGTDGRDVFMKDQDYSRFILSLEFFNSQEEISIWQLVARAGSDPARAMGERIAEQRKHLREPIVQLLAFALMPNHYHLLVREIITGGISFFMQKMGGYSFYFNQQYNRQGSLFQSRYKCVEIKSDAQLLAVFNYIHTNPIGLIEPMWKNQQVKNFSNAKNFLANYKWSSYQDYVGIPAFSNVINKEFFLKILSNQEDYKKETENWIEFKAKNYIQSNELNLKNLE